MVVVGVAVDGRTPGAPADAGPPQKSRRRWVRWAALCTAVATCAAVLGYVANNEVEANTRFDQAHRALDATRGHLGLVQTSLTTVRADLKTVDKQVGLDTTTLAQDTTQLQGVETALTNARASVVNQTMAMHDLQVCLGGVERGLNALSVGDRVHALDALTAVSASCTAAIVANG